VVDTCKYGNELPNSIKGGQFLDQLSNFQLGNKNYIHELYTYVLVGCLGC
jgi:hypothetical protein